MKAIVTVGVRGSQYKEVQRHETDVPMPLADNELGVGVSLHEIMSATMGDVGAPNAVVELRVEFREEKS